MKQANPLLAMEEERGNQEASKIADALLTNKNFAKQGNVKYIPVVFHVIHNGGSENITQAQIMDQMRILNEDFRKKAGSNGDKSTNPNATDMEFEFRLAQVDPNGIRHDGINRIQSTATENASDNVKALSRWNSSKYLNIWVVKSISLGGSSGGTVLGYAQFPFYMSFSPNNDGIVIRADYVGSIQSGNSSHMGRTLTHEVGHWVGLYHPFQDGCAGQSASNCSSAGDRVCDTPPVSEANYGSVCDATLNSCTGNNPDLPDMINNYMDYLDGDIETSIYYANDDRKNAINQANRDPNLIMYQSDHEEFGLNGAQVKPGDRTSWPTTLISDKSRVYKGGSWKDRAYWLASGSRRFLDEDKSTCTIGFRCCMSRQGSPTGINYQNSKKKK
jgi:hypothetical protein